MDDSIRLLVADADASVREIVRVCCAEQGWQCDEARDGIAALKLMRRKEFDVFVLENELPEIDGCLVCRQIRKNARTPVMFMSRRVHEEDRLLCFDAGGNDYVLKPFYPRELVARIKSMLSLTGVSTARREALVVGGMRIDLASREVFVGGRKVSLTPREYELLLFMCNNPHKVFSRDALLDLVWGQQFFGTDRTVDTHVKSLRGKIAPNHDYIVTVWGVGYKFEPD